MSVRLICITTLLCFLLHSCVVVAQDVAPATVTDEYGNTADVNSQLTFADLPEIDPYETDPDSYSYAGLKPFYDGMHGFVNICFGKIPYDLILSLSGNFTIDKITTQENIMQIVQWGVGYVICLVIGLLFILFFPIVGCCFCCCRTCCNNCGGKMVQKRNGNSDTWRSCFITTMLISCCFLGAGMICVYVTNERTSTMLVDISETITVNVNDLQRYAKNTLKHVRYVAEDGYAFTADVIIRDLDNLGTVVGSDIKQDLNDQANVDDAFNELLALDPVLKQLIDDLTAVNTAKTSVESSVTALDTAMSGVATDIEDTFTSCGASCGTAPDVSALRDGSNFDPSSMPSFDNELAELQAVYNQNLTASVLRGKNEFDNIPDTVETEAAPVVNSIKDLVNGFDDQITQALDSADDMLAIFDTINDFSSSLSDPDNMTIVADLTLSDVENYRWMGGVGLTSFVLLILVLQLVGTVLGCLACCCCGDKNALPTERGAAGNCGGCLLMASVGFVFIFGALIMLLVWSTFIIGAPVESILCANLRDPEYTALKNLVEGGKPTPGVMYKTVLGETSGYMLSQLIFSNASIPLTVSGVLEACKQDKAAWQALPLSSFIDIRTLTDFNSTVDVDAELDNLNVDLSGLVLLNPNTKTQLTDMKDSLSAINFNGLKTALNAATVTADFSQLITELDAAADAISADATKASIEADLRAYAAELSRIEGDELSAVSTAQQSMLTLVTSLETTVTPVPTQIDSLILTVETTQTEIQTNGAAIVTQSAKTYADRIIRAAQQFVDFVLDALENDIGKCSPIYNFYQSALVNTVCGSVIDSLNGFWFALGWCLFFMFLGIIFSTKLAKHIRRMHEMHPDDTDNGRKVYRRKKTAKVSPA